MFADYCFRIVRINEGGCVKIRYSGNSTSYENAHSNKYNSTIKTNIYNWYVNNILNKGDNIKNVIANTIYCNDRSCGNAINVYKNYSSLGTDPIFKCNQSNDKFTLSVDNGDKKLFGNYKLNYPVTTLTADEAAAGLI